MANMTFKASLLPNTDLGYSLGSDDKKWNIYGNLTGNASTAAALKDRSNNTLTYSNYGAAALTASAITWLACWNGYELRAISKAEMANAVDESHKWVRIDGDTMNGILTIDKRGSWSGLQILQNTTSVILDVDNEQNGNHGLWSSGYWNGSTYTTAGKWLVYRGTDGNVNLNGNAATATTATTASRLTDITTTDKASASATNRRIWFAYDNNTTGRPAYDDNFTYQVSSGTMRVKQIYYLAYGGTYGTGGQGAIWYNGTSGVTQSGESADRLRASRTFQAPKVYGAVWNDYAEYRETKEKIEPGRCVRETGKGDLVLTDARMQEGCEIVSDTFGFAIGESEKCKTPTAATGRVLAYLYEDKELAKPGRPVCSGPNGTISLMTNEEAREYPWCIIGTVSEVPDYEIWHAGSNGDQEIKVNGRIWIRIR